MVAATGGLTVLQILKILEPYDVAAGAPPERSGSARKIAWAEDAALEFPSTSPISVVDRSGNAVAMTTTIEFAFGSKLMTKSGFLLNNEITDFSFVPFEDGTRVID